MKGRRKIIVMNSSKPKNVGGVVKTSEETCCRDILSRENVVESHIL